MNRLKKALDRLLIFAFIVFVAVPALVFAVLVVELKQLKEPGMLMLATVVVLIALIIWYELSRPAATPDDSPPPSLEELYRELGLEDDGGKPK